MAENKIILENELRQYEAAVAVDMEHKQEIAQENQLDVKIAELNIKIQNSNEERKKLINQLQDFVKDTQDFIVIRQDLSKKYIDRYKKFKLCKDMLLGFFQPEVNYVCNELTNEVSEEVSRSEYDSELIRKVCEMPLLELEVYKNNDDINDEVLDKIVLSELEKGSMMALGKFIQNAYGAYIQFNKEYKILFVEDQSKLLNFHKRRDDFNTKIIQYNENLLKIDQERLKMVDKLNKKSDGNNKVTSLQILEGAKKSRLNIPDDKFRSSLGDIKTKLSLNSNRNISSDNLEDGYFVQMLQFEDIVSKLQDQKKLVEEDDCEFNGLLKFFKKYDQLMQKFKVQIEEQNSRNAHIIFKFLKYNNFKQQISQMLDSVMEELGDDINQNVATDTKELFMKRIFTQTDRFYADKKLQFDIFTLNHIDKYFSEQGDKKVWITENFNMNDVFGKVNFTCFDMIGMEDTLQYSNISIKNFLSLEFFEENKQDLSMIRTQFLNLLGNNINAYNSSEYIVLDSDLNNILKEKFIDLLDSDFIKLRQVAQEDIFNFAKYLFLKNRKEEFGLVFRDLREFKELQNKKLSLFNKVVEKVGEKQRLVLQKFHKFKELENKKLDVFNNVVRKISAKQQKAFVIEKWLEFKDVKLRQNAEENVFNFGEQFLNNNKEEFMLAFKGLKEFKQELVNKNIGMAVDMKSNNWGQEVIMQENCNVVLRQGDIEQEIFEQSEELLGNENIRIEQGPEDLEQEVLLEKKNIGVNQEIFEPQIFFNKVENIGVIEDDESELEQEVLLKKKNIGVNQEIFELEKVMQIINSNENQVLTEQNEELLKNKILGIIENEKSELEHEVVSKTVNSGILQTAEKIDIGQNNILENNLEEVNEFDQCIKMAKQLHNDKLKLFNMMFNKRVENDKRVVLQGFSMADEYNQKLQEAENRYKQYKLFISMSLKYSIVKKVAFRGLREFNQQVSDQKLRNKNTGIVANAELELGSEQIVFINDNTGVNQETFEQEVFVRNVNSGAVDAALPPEEGAVDIAVNGSGIRDADDIYVNDIIDMQDHDMIIHWKDQSNDNIEVKSLIEEVVDLKEVENPEVVETRFVLYGANEVEDKNVEDKNVEDKNVEDKNVKDKNVEDKNV
ncbi:MAG: hypothetical protein AAFO15_02410, partial [Pseudomonadota bacterium]